MSKLKSLLALFLSLSLLFSCHRSNPADGKKIFRYNEVAGIATLDPAFAKDQALIWATSQLYNGLIRLDTNLNPEPCIAKSCSATMSTSIATLCFSTPTPLGA